MFDRYSTDYISVPLGGIPMPTLAYTNKNLKAVLTVQRRAHDVTRFRRVFDLRHVMCDLTRLRADQPYSAV